MSIEPTNGESYSNLIEQIKQAFAHVPYPGDDNIISTPEHIAVCDECRDLHTVLVGRKWPELIEDDESSGHVGHAMSFFSAAGWQYYLPAYLIQSIKRQRFSLLYFFPNNDPELIDYHEARINRLTGEQCQAVFAYLLVAEKEDRFSEYMDERDRETIEHWEENCRRIVSRNQDADDRQQSAEAQT